MVVSRLQKELSRLYAAIRPSVVCLNNVGERPLLSDVLPRMKFRCRPRLRPAALLALLFSLAGAIAAAERLNVLWIISDDLRLRYGESFYPGDCPETKGRKPLQPGFLPPATR